MFTLPPARYDFPIAAVVSRARGVLAHTVRRLALTEVGVHHRLVGPKHLQQPAVEAGRIMARDPVTHREHFLFVPSVNAGVAARE